MMRLRGEAAFDFSRNGTLAYVSARPEPQYEPVFVSMSGEPQDRVLPPPGYYDRPRYAPGDANAVVMSAPYRAREYALTIHRSGFAPDDLRVADARSPVWDADGRRMIAVRDTSQGSSEFLLVDPESDDPPTVLFETTEGIAHAGAVTPDRKALIFQMWSGEAYRLHEFLFEASQYRDLLPGRTQSVEGALSPSGDRLAYEADGEIYVRAYAAGGSLGPERTVSIGGGSLPRWSHDGRAVFYRRGESMMAADVGAAPDAIPSPPRQLFEGSFTGVYDVAPDGSGFLMFEEVRSERPEPDKIIVIINWFEELKRLVPPGR
jgi:hypothetical protein